MFSLLAFRNFLHKPWRSALLFLGFGMGVSVMIVLLSIGEAMVTQAQDERLVGGGDVTVLPEGIDIEVMKTGGLGGLFFSIPNARFVYLQLLASPRLEHLERAVAPESDGKLLYLTTPDGVERTVRSAGDLPSATSGVGAAPRVLAGAWIDDSTDRRWTNPTAAELEADIDRFHVPPQGLANRQSWAEWHYFNVVSGDRRRWVFISFIVAGDVPRDHAPNGRWGARVLVTAHATIPGISPARQRRFVATVSPADVEFSTTTPDVRLGTSSVTLLPDGRYAVHARVGEEVARPERAGENRAGGAMLDLDLVVTPAPRVYFPGAAIETGDFASGYTVPALKGDATGRLCIEEPGSDGSPQPPRCERFDGTQAYHDHNWGVWRGVTWEWGAARAGQYALLYGRIQPPDSLGGSAPLFVYLVDSLGFRAVFRPQRILYDDSRTLRIGDRTLHVPARAVLSDARGSDTVRVDLTVEDAVATDTRGPPFERGATEAARLLTHPYFIQMKGLARISGRLDGAPITGQGAGFFETYR